MKADPFSFGTEKELDFFSECENNIAFGRPMDSRVEQKRFVNRVHALAWLLKKAPIEGTCFHKVHSSYEGIKSLQECLWCL